MPNSFDQNTFINLLNITDGNAQPAIEYGILLIMDTGQMFLTKILESYQKMCF